MARLVVSRGVEMLRERRRDLGVFVSLPTYSARAHANMFRDNLGPKLAKMLESLPKPRDATLSQSN